MDQVKRSFEIRRSVAVVGSTASGKSALASALASAYSGEIISVDSMQVYRGFDIGTAKPTAAERAAVLHHMIDICAPEENFSAAEFAVMALACAEDISARGRLPIFCGGTGLYLDCVLRGGAPEETGGDARISQALSRDLDEMGAAALHARLKAVDPVSAAAIHENNVRRVRRALEIYYVTGKPKSQWDRESRQRPAAVDLYVIGLAYHNRDLLYARIDRRVDEMLRAGLLDEVRRLYESGALEKNRTAAGAIGYKELVPVLLGTCTLKEAAAALKTATRRYAKRQITWFSAKDYVHPLFCDTPEGEMRAFEDIFAQCSEMLRQNGF